MDLVQTKRPSSAQALSIAESRQNFRAYDLFSNPRLSIIIVNYCQWRETVRLTRQILASPPGRKGDVEIVIVDNHSPPHPLVRQLRRWPGVSLRRWKRNRGFARAVNEGCRLSRGRWHLLLNPNVTLRGDFLTGVLKLIEFLGNQCRDVGVVGFHLLNNDGSSQLSTGGFPTLGTTLSGLLLPRTRRKYWSPATDWPAGVPWVTGCCLLVRRECLDQVGGFDEDFFCYYEDVDFCRRAAAHGWSIRYEPGLRGSPSSPPLASGFDSPPPDHPARASDVWTEALAALAISNLGEHCATGSLGAAGMGRFPMRSTDGFAIPRVGNHGRRIGSRSAVSLWRRRLNRVVRGEEGDHATAAVDCRP